MVKNECMDSYETKCECLGETEGDISFKGWNIVGFTRLIKEELEDHFQRDIIDLDIKAIKHMAYSCSRYSDYGDDATEEGYSYWLNYYDTWKRGLGKCTCFKVSYKKVDERSKR